MERENLHCVTRPMGGVKGQATSGSNREGESTDTQRRDGAARSSDEGPVMGLERRGCVVQPEAMGQLATGGARGQGKAVRDPQTGSLGSLQACEGQPGSGWSRRTVDSEIRGQPFGQPLQALESNVVRELLSSAGAAGRYSEGGWWDAAVGHSNGRRSRCPGGGPSVSGADFGAGVSSGLLWLPARQICDRCRAPSSPALLALRLGARSRCQGAFFDSIDWELLLKAVRQHTDCPWVLLYVERWLKAPVQMEDGSVVPRTAGTPQGGVISPLLANLFLHYAFDTWMARNYPHIPFERYADDAICHCQKRRGGAGAMERACRSSCGLQAGAASGEDEDRLLQGCEPARRLSYHSFDFLGFQFRARKTIWNGKAAHGFMPAASPKALTAISRTVRRWSLHHRSDKSLQGAGRRCTTRAFAAGSPTTATSTRRGCVRP